MRKKKAIRNRKATHGKKKSTQGKRRVVRKRPASRDLKVMEIEAVEPAGLGPDAAGQSGDIEGLSNVATGDSESVAELVEEGQDLEAENVSGVENAPDPDEAEVRTHGRQR
jgi:hypothetical protein